MDQYLTLEMNDTVPDFQTFFLPLLKLISKKGVLHIRDPVDILSDEFDLSDKPSHIDVTFLEKFPSFIEFRNAKKEKPKATSKLRDGI